MTAWAWIAMLGRSSLLMLVAAMVVELTLRLLWVRTPRLRRIAWGAVLLLGVTWPGFDVTVPWWPAVANRPAIAAHPVTSAVESPRVPPVVVTEDHSVERAANLREPAPELSSYAWLETWVCVLWLAGIVLIAARLAWCYARFARNLRRFARPCDGAWQRCLLEVAAEAGWEKVPRLMSAPGIGPLVWQGWHGAAIVVPDRDHAQLSDEQRCTILRHELAHWRRGDLWTALAARIVALPHWFNPAAAWSVRRFEEAADWACDDAAAKNPAAASEFAKVLLQLGWVEPEVRWLPTAARRSTLGRRIERLVQPNKNKESIVKRIVLGCVIGSLLLIAGVRVTLVAQESETEPREVTTEKSPAVAPSGSSTSTNAPVESPEDKAIPREKLRYKEKPFQYWADIAREDLSTPVRMEALDAMRMFGRRGYAAEAIAVCFDVAEDYPRGFYPPPGMLQNQTIELTTLDEVVTELASIAPEQVVAELESTSLARCRLAIRAIASADREIALRFIPLLAKAGLHNDVNIAHDAVVALVNNVRDPRSRGAILDVIKNSPHDRFIDAYTMAALNWPRADARLHDLLKDYLTSASQGDRHLVAMRMVGITPSNVRSIVALLGDSDPVVRAAAIEAVNRGYCTKEDYALVVEAVIRAIAMGGQDVIVPGIEALGKYALMVDAAREFLEKLEIADQIPDEIRDRAKGALAGVRRAIPPLDGVQAVAEEALKSREKKPSP